MTPAVDISKLRGKNSLVAFDLDDTLAPEALFIRSGARHAALWLHRLYPAADPFRIINAVDLAVDNRQNHYSAVENILDSFGLLRKVNMSIVVNEFRSHTPDHDIYRMAPSMISLLNNLSDADVCMALVTDGRSITQRNKINTLGLDQWFSPDHIFISEEIGHDKTHPYSFVRLMEMHPEVEDFHYVGDNPPKDFLHPSRLGWLTHLADPFPLGVHCGLPR